MLRLRVLAVNNPSGEGYVTYYTNKMITHVSVIQKAEEDTIRVSRADGTHDTWPADAENLAEVTAWALRGDKAQC